MRKTTQWYDFKEKDQLKVRFPKIKNDGRKLEFYVPRRPTAIWIEGVYIFALFVDSEFRTSKVIKYSMAGHAQNEISQPFSVLESRWKLTKTFNNYPETQTLNMTLNQVNEEGDLTRCV